MKTRVPEIIGCVNCGHNIVAKLYEVDTTINSAQGHFHTVHNPAEPAYTVYCINCGHFMTNDPSGSPPKPAPAGTAARSTAVKRSATPPGGTSAARPRNQASKPAQRTAPKRAEKRKPASVPSTAKPRQKPVQARGKEKPSPGPKKSSPDKRSRPHRKKAK